MAHFAKIDSNNIVTDVIVINNEVMKNEFGVESEQHGIDFCKSLYGEHTRWVQTSYNNTFRGEFAGMGFLYDVEADVFVNPYPEPPLPEIPN